MSLIKMDLIHAFGSTCSQKYQNCIAICDDDKNETKIVFPVGKALAKKYIDHAQMEFVPFSDSIDSIHNISILPTKAHVAVAYKPIGSPLHAVKIYPFQRQEQPITIRIFHEHEKAGVVRLIAFSSSQPKFMCVLLGDPHNKMLFIDTIKNKALAQSNFTLKQIDKISVCPLNSHLICATGGSNIKLFKVQQYTFKPLEDIKKLPKGRRITTHAWSTRKTILAATDKCQILILEQGKHNIYEIRQEYHNVFNEPKYDKMLVTAICTFSKGFILGSNNGKFSLWTKKQDESQSKSQTLELSRKWCTTDERASQVTNIEISSKEDIIALSLANNDLATLYLHELIPQVSDLLNDIHEKQIVFQYLYKGFHNNPVTGIDVCEQRPLVATCSRQDSTIRIWNYKNFGCKLLRMFYFKVKEEFENEKPLLTLAFHPSGYYIAVGCIDKLRFFHVLNNQLRPYRELAVKNAHIVKFSNGGHLLAACFPFRDETNIDHIKVFNSLTLEELIIFKDHTSMIKNIQFKKFDECLLSISEEGMIVEWRLSDWSKLKTIQKKEMVYQTAIYLHQRKTIIAFGTYNGKKYLEEYSCESNSFTQQEVDMNIIKMAEVVLGKEKAIILTLENGSIVVFGGLQKPIIMDCKSQHIQKANQIALSPCGKYLMTTGQDSVILIHKLSCWLEGVVQEEISNITVDDFLADVVLINKQEIVKVNEKEKQFTKAISNLSKKLKIFSDEGLKIHNKRLLEIQLQKNRIIDDFHYRIDRLNNQVMQLRSKNISALESLDKNHFNRAEQTEKTYEEKINFQIQKYFQLQQELIQMKVVHKKQVEKLKLMEEEQVNRLKKQFQIKFKQSQQIYSSSKKESESASHIFSQRLQQIQNQQEDQSKQLISKKQKFKQEAALTLQELHQKQIKLKKEHARLTDQKNKEKEENEQRLHTKKKLEKQVEQNNQKLKEMNQQYQQKAELLSVKEKRIIDFDLKITQLQKKKHILSYKGTQMKKAIEPKEVQIQKLKLDLIKLKKQFQLSLERKQKEVLAMERNEKEKANLQKIFNKQKQETQEEVELMDQILTDIAACIDTGTRTNDSKLYYKELIKIYHKYINKNSKNENPTEAKGIEEITKQIVHLEKSLFQINRSNQKNILRKNDQIYKRSKENAELVNNLNQIKKENKELILKIKAKKEEIEKLRNQKTSLLAECKTVDAHTYKMFLQDDFIQDKPEKPSITRNSSTNKMSINSSHKELLNQGKNAYQKIQCELISEIQFTNEKNHKLQFYLKEIKQKIKKHLNHYRCNPDIFSYEDEISEIHEN